MCKNFLISAQSKHTHREHSPTKLGGNLFKTQLIYDKRIRLHCTKCGKAFKCKADQHIHSSKRWELHYYQFQPGKARNWRGKHSFNSKTCTKWSKCVFECTLMRLISPTKLARYTLQANMSYWVLEASMINFKITSTIKAIKSQILCKKQLAGATNASMYSYETHFPQS